MAEIKTEKDLAELYRRARRTINKIEMVRYPEKIKNPDDDRRKSRQKEPLPTREQFKQLVSNEDIFEKIALYPFYSNKKAVVVDRYADRIVEHLGDYKKLVSYIRKDKVDSEVKKMMADPKMFKHETKIRAAISNAEKYQELIADKEIGSFVDYVFKFHPYDDKEKLWNLLVDMRKKFDQFGIITSMHVLMNSHLDLPLIKPDLNIMRTFFRIGLVDRDNDFKGTYFAACTIAEAAEVPVPWIDNFVSLGLKDFFYKGSHVCGNTPDCNREKNPCEIKELCDWWQKKYGKDG